MATIRVSEHLHDKLEDAALDGDIEPTLWEMVYRFERCNGTFE